MSALDELRQLPDALVLTDEPMSGHTSFRIGGPADVLVLPRSIAAVRGAVCIAAEHQLPLHILGDGSNVLVRDGGLRGVVLKMADNLVLDRFQGTLNYETMRGPIRMRYSQPYAYWPKTPKAQ